MQSTTAQTSTFACHGMSKEAGTWRKGKWDQLSFGVCCPSVWQHASECGPASGTARLAGRLTGSQCTLRYARISGKPGVLIVTSGPGATNAITPMQDALSDGTPLVVLAGQVSNHHVSGLHIACPRLVPSGDCRL